MQAQTMMKEMPSIFFHDATGFAGGSSLNKSFDLLKKDTFHPSLHLKKVPPYWSVRVGKRHRALAVEVESGLLWFWIGTHAEYDQIVR